MSGTGKLPFGRALRAEWLLEPRMDFLNHGSFGATPRRVLAEQDRWRLQMERQPLHFFTELLPTALRDAATQLGGLVGSAGEDLAFVDNATTGVNAVLRSLSLEPDDEVLTTNHVYGAVARTIDFVTRRAGARGVFLDVPFPPRDPEQVIELLAAAITPRTKIAVVDHITSATGLVLPVKRLIELCRERGLPVLVDGAHGPGMLPLNLTELGADWYTGNCHKWLCSAKGCAFLWTNPHSQVARSNLHPTVISHGLDEDWPAEFDFVGTRDYTPYLSLPAALAFHQELGPERIHRYIRELVIEAGANLCAAWGVESAVPAAMIGSLLTLPIPQEIEGDQTLAFALRKKVWETHRIEVPFVPFNGKIWLRISAQVYNELSDYRRLEDIFPL